MQGAQGRQQGVALLSRQLAEFCHSAGRFRHLISFIRKVRAEVLEDVARHVLQLVWKEERSAVAVHELAVHQR